MDKYKSKTITLRNSTHSKLYKLSKAIVPGLDLSIPQTIEKVVEEKLSNSEGTYKGTGTANDSQRQKV